MVYHGVFSSNWSRVSTENFQFIFILFHHKIEEYAFEKHKNQMEIVFSPQNMSILRATQNYCVIKTKNEYILNWEVLSAVSQIYNAMIFYTFLKGADNCEVNFRSLP